MSDRSQLDLSKPFNRGNKLFVYNFDEKSTLRKTRFDVLRAFQDGFTCFQFRFTYRGRKFGDPKSPEDNVALPPAAGYDEHDALEMATIAHMRFQNTVAKLIAG